MMMSDMPQDLIEEILSRVPAASLKRLRSTCKRWNKFVKKIKNSQRSTFLKAPKQSRILMSDDYRICAVNVDLNVSPPPIEFKDFHSCSQQVDVVFVEEKLGGSKPQPVLGVELPLGYQNNKSFRSYKILNCWSTGCTLDQGVAGF
ncbi:F-box protein [Raphanus sativus]|nr:F-box protein [Raphanus sativus]